MARPMTMIDAGFKVFRMTGIDRALRPATRGRGVILALHRVRPWRAATPGFSPNASLEITPEFLDDTLKLMGRLGYEFVSLGEARRRLAHGGGPPFAALTFDDGYTDFRDFAAPVLQRRGAPSTVFFTTGFLNRTAQLWWLELEEAIRRLSSVEVNVGGFVIRCETVTVEEKCAAYERIYWALRALKEVDLLEAIAALAAHAGVTSADIYGDNFLDWDAARAVAAHPLVEIGAHSHTHRRLAHWPEEMVREEMAGSRAELERRLGKPARHFAFPVGDATSAGQREFTLARDLGFLTAVTTRPGVLYGVHADHLHALPRLSVNGLFQDARALESLVSGAPTTLLNFGRRVNVA